MPRLKARIANNQPLIEVVILLPDNTAAAVKGLFDTGAMHNYISENIANQLGLQPTGKMISQTANSRLTSNTYNARMGFLFKREDSTQIKILDETLFVGIPDMQDRGWHILIGMDIIQKGYLVIGKGKFSFYI